MTRYACASTASAAMPPKRRVRALAIAMAVALASGVALAAWSNSDAMAPAPGAMVPRGQMLEHLLDEAQASPTQRAQVRQIFGAADAASRMDRAAERSDRAQMGRLFAQATVDTAAIDALSGRIERRRDLESRRATQALIDVGVVLTPQQRQTLAGQLAGGPRPFAAFSHPHPAIAVND